MLKLSRVRGARRPGGAYSRSSSPTRAAVNRLNRAAWKAHGEDPHRAIATATRAIAAAAALGYPWGSALGRYALGASYAQLDSYEAARSELMAALEGFEALGAREPQANVLNMLGNIHSALGDHHAAYALYLRSLAIRQSLGLTKAEAASWNNIGNAYYHLGDYPQALEAHQRSLALKESLGDWAGVAVSLNNIGNVHKASDDLASALRHYQQGLALAQEVGNKYSQAGALGNLGTVYAALGSPQTSLDHHLQSLAIEREIGNRHGEAESFLQLGRLFLLHAGLRDGADAGEPDGDPALRYLRQAKAIAEDLQANEILMHVAELLAQLYEQRGDLAQAIAHYRQFHALERALFNETISEKTKKLQIIHQVERAQNEARLKQIEAELAHIKNNELQGLLDEAERQRARAEQANGFKTKLLSVAAHDLRNPLSGISGFSDLLLMQLAVDSPQQEIALRIRQSARRMEHMLNNLLDSTRIEAEGLALKIEPIDLDSLVRQVVDVYQIQAQKKRQPLIVCAGEASVILADQSSMWRVLENLIGNAIKFSPYERRIWVKLERRGQHVRCSVCDEGPGLTEDDQQKIFGRFERLSATPTGGESSTGLGLAIVRQLVELQGGRVWAESAGAGQGSAFIVELPAL